MPNKREELIDFSILEDSKENIQSLPGGRSAKQLAAILSPVSGGLNAPTPEETKTLNDAMRQEYEKELQTISDRDDPLDVYDRYVKWALSAYTSAQATKESQLLPLLERATKAFLTAAHYKNDPRYLKLWLHYIRLFSDSPRETFSYLARHNIGENLSLFYEEFAAWFETNDRWTQAEEVYKLGLEKQAYPSERLARKYDQFQKRFEARPQDSNEPTSPAVPRVRAALAAKIDPFAPSPAETPQAATQQGAQPRPTTSKSGKPKMAIFSDTSSEAPVAQSSAQGWDNIGSMRDRRKENTIEAKPWTGEKLQAGGRVGSASKMAIFKDPSISRHDLQMPPPPTSSNTIDPRTVVDPRTNRAQQVFVDFNAIYPSWPDETVEYSIEELRAARRGWLTKSWESYQSPLRKVSGNAVKQPKVNTDPAKVKDCGPQSDVENLTQDLKDVSLVDTSTQSMVGMPDSKPAKPRRTKIREVKQETQTVKLNLDSPTGKKLKRKNNAEPTMTFHSKAATNEIYDMFNQTCQQPDQDDTQSGNDTDYDDDTYSTAGESTGTGRMSAVISEFGDETLARVAAGGSLDNNTQSSQPTSVSPWSEFTASKHVPKVDAGSRSVKGHKYSASDDLTDQLDCQNQTQTFGIDSFDTQAIAAIANQDFDELKTQDIARLAGDMPLDDDDDTASQHPEDATSATDFGELKTPIEEEPPYDTHIEVQQEDRYVPIPPEDYEPTPLRSRRDPYEAAQNKLPFMTPIAEQTESSIGGSTAYKKTDYFKTPSRQNGRHTGYESPSGLALGELAMSSPQPQSPSPDKAGSPSPKRRLETIVDDEELQGSPVKKLHHSLLDDAPQDLMSTPAVEEEFVAVGRPPKARVPSQPSHDDEFQLQRSPVKALQRSLMERMPRDLMPTPPAEEVVPKIPQKPAVFKPEIPAKPVIHDAQCNPISDEIRSQIICSLVTPIADYPGYDERPDESFAQLDTLKSYTKASKSAKQSPRKSQSLSAHATGKPEPCLLFAKSSRVYAVKRELGSGAYATAYLASSADKDTPAAATAVLTPTTTPSSSPRRSLALSRSTTPALNTSGRGDYEAIKAEAHSSAHTLQFEFHIIRLLHSRLSTTSPRAVASIITAHELHLYRDEAYLILSYTPQGTLLDLLNATMTDNHARGKSVDGVGMDEALAMFFGVEVLRTMESLHSVGILHGDLKADNCLVRFDLSTEITDAWNAAGDHGWASRGLILIDFGRGIDTKCFVRDVKFVADWSPSAQDCVEVRECRPWKWSLDFYGAAGILHSLLFGKYLSTVTVPVLQHSMEGVGEGGEDVTMGIKTKKEVRVKEVMKRYMSKEVWGEVFGVLLNKGGLEADAAVEGDGGNSSRMEELRRVRSLMEEWLLVEGEKRGLRERVRAAERLVAARR